MTEEEAETVMKIKKDLVDRLVVEEAQKKIDIVTINRRADQTNIDLYCKEETHNCISLLSVFLN